jgi:hypothetical protein
MYRIYVATVTLLAAGLAVAQGPRNQDKGGMMGTGMGPGMGPGMMAAMHDPMHEAVVAAFGLPQVKTELGLSTQQETQLRQLKDELLTKGDEFSAQIAAKQKELAAAAGAGKNADVKLFLEQIAVLRAQTQFAAFETAGNMKAALTEPQRAKAAGHEFHHTLMMHMTMGDMEHVMQFMGAAPGNMGMNMMGMHMMGGGMMMHDMMNPDKKKDSKKEPMHH